MFMILCLCAFVIQKITEYNLLKRREYEM